MMKLKIIINLLNVQQVHYFEHSLFIAQHQRHVNHKLKLFKYRISTPLGRHFPVIEKISRQNLLIFRVFPECDPDILFFQCFLYCTVLL